jgi:hypothetical protein
MPVYLAETDAQAFERARPQVEQAHLNPGMLRANRLVAEAGFFGTRNPGRLKFFQTMGGHAPPPLEQQIEMGLLLCGSPSSVLDQLMAVRDRLGAGVVSLDFSRGNRSDVQRTMEFFGREVLPGMQAL